WRLRPYILSGSTSITTRQAEADVLRPSLWRCSLDLKPDTTYSVGSIFKNSLMFLEENCRS
ncbi:unnamed protein product, partial [Musa hybrid cultivar]